MSSVSQSTPASILAPDARLASRARQGDTRALAYEASKTLVTEGLVKPVFASLRDGGFAAGPFAPGTAEKRFRPMLDAILADKVVEGSNFALVDRAADRFEQSIERRRRGSAAPEGAVP
jgi:hypothetical protein